MSTLLSISIAMLSAVALLFGAAPVRRRLLGDPLLRRFRRVLPQVSQTEQEALDAGTVWWEGDLFRGRPDWARLHAFPAPALTREERDFLDGPVQVLCEMLDEWRISHELNDLPPEAWRFIRERGFLGMIIPKQYGGLGFSALAHGEVVMKLATRSPTCAVTVMVPNSLGPAELLLHYGTEEQKQHHLPRLAAGVDIPCFALTGPEAGSDANAIPDIGIVCRGMHAGREVMGIRLSWEKRYITLGPVATLLGLAFKLRDPDHLLGSTEDVGITLALIPTDHPGVRIGRRHLPLDASFMNGPNAGDNVFIPIDWVIGGAARVGQGWRMLMECLAAGRAISLPSTAAAGCKVAARTSGAYARIRTQFRSPIARFEGVEEALARIAGHTYVVDAARRMTAGAVDLGERPSVASAIIKYHATERCRLVINDAMDIHGGKAICLGPSNYLGRAYQQLPIAVTVEGANILTRTLIIFGQGAIRCHPHVRREMAAAHEADPRKASIGFDAAVWQHAGFVCANFLRACTSPFGIGGRASIPGHAALRQHYRDIHHLSVAFAFAADVAMLTLGASIKRREKLSGRLADILGQLYLATAVLKRFEDDGRPASDLPLVHWGVQDALARAEDAFAGLAANFPHRLAARAIRLAAFPLGRRHPGPSDALGAAVAATITSPSPARDRLTQGMFLPQDEADPIGRLDMAFALADPVAAIRTRLRAARRDAAGGTVSVAAEGDAEGMITASESALMERYRSLQRACIMVDDFPPGVGGRPAGRTEDQTSMRAGASVANRIDQKIRETQSR